MKTYIVPAVTGIAALIVGVVIGMNLDTHKNKDSSQNIKQSTKIVRHNINTSKETDNWKITIKDIQTQKVEKKKKEFAYHVMDDNNVLDQRSDWYYRNVITVAFDNKTDRTVSSAASNGELSLVDGDGNARFANGINLNSFVDITPNSIITFPANSKTTVTFVTIGNKNDFNYKNMKIVVPTYYSNPSDVNDNPFDGGTFDFKI